MKKKIVVIAAVSLFAMTAQSVFACGNNCGGGNHDGRNDPPPKVTIPNNNLNSNNLGVGVGVNTAANANAAAYAGSSSQSSSGAVAVGGAGGTGIASQSLNASTGTMSTGVQTGNVKTGDSSSTSSPSDIGNGNGSQVTSTTNNSQIMNLPVQVSSLPATFALGGVTLKKIRECGWRVKITPFKNFLHIPQVFGAFQSKYKVETMEGIYEGPDLEHPLIEVEARFGNRTIVSYTGQVLYAGSGAVSQGGGSSSALNHANGEAWGGGLALNANGSIGQVGMVAFPCPYDPVKAGLVPPTVIEKTEKQSIVLKKGVTKKAIPAGTPYFYWAPSLVKKTETINGVPVKSAK
ncbi:MAG: hypothetical protein ACYC6X_03350 [Minisyncoccota bacterium]